MSVDDISGEDATTDPCPLELVTRGDEVVLWVDTGERLEDVELSYEAAYRIADEFVQNADQAAVNAGVIGDD